MGGKSAPAPDYSGMERVANRQLDFSERQYNEMKPVLTGLADTMSAAQQQQMEAASYNLGMQKIYDQSKLGLLRDAEAYDTDARRAQISAQAATDAANAFATTQGMAARDMARRGINPSSGAALALNNQNAVSNAALRANSANQARTAAEQMGQSMRFGAVGLGNPFAGQALGSFGGATGAGQAAGGMYAAPGTQYMQGLSSAGTTYGNMANTQASVYNNAMNAEGEFWGSVLGAGARVGAAVAGSDRRLKQDIVVVGRDAKTGLPLYEFSYKSDPTRRFIGVMADEAEKVMPAAVSTGMDGFKRVDYAMLGIEMLEV